MSKLSDFEFNEQVENVRLFVVENAEEIGLIWRNTTRFSCRSSRSTWLPERAVNCCRHSCRDAGAGE
jgi:hypothetical protein